MKPIIKKTLFLLALMGVLSQALGADFQKGQTVYALGSSVNIRAEPRTDAKVLLKLPIGGMAIFDRTAGEWAYVQLKEKGAKGGYVLLDLLSAEPPSLPALIAKYDRTPKRDLAERRKWAERAAALDPADAGAQSRLLAVLDEINEREAAVFKPLFTENGNAKKITIAQENTLDDKHSVVLLRVVGQNEKLPTFALYVVERATKKPVITLNVIEASPGYEAAIDNVGRNYVTLSLFSARNDSRKSSAGTVRYDFDVGRGTFTARAQGILPLLQKKDADIDRYYVYDERRISDRHSVSLVMGTSSRKPNAPGGEGVLGALFIVESATGQPYMTIDFLPITENPWVFMQASADFVIVARWEKYLSYSNSRIYEYDLKKRAVVANSPYRWTPIAAVDRQEGSLLVFADSESGPFYTRIHSLPDGNLKVVEQVLSPQSPVVTTDSMYRTVEGLWKKERREGRPRNVSENDDGRPPVSFKYEGLTVQVTPEAIKISDAARMQEYPVPKPTYEDYVRLRDKSSNRPSENARIVQTISSAQLHGSKIWFGYEFFEGLGVTEQDSYGNPFYGLESNTGVGGLGSFDLKTRKFDVKYPDLLVHLSAAVVFAEGTTLWLRLYSRSTYGENSSGFAKYDLKSGSFTAYKTQASVTSTVRWNNMAVWGTQDGVYFLAGSGRVKRMIWTGAGKNGPVPRIIDIQ